MTEDRIERMVEAMIDALDAKFIANGHLTSAEYNAEIVKIEAWAEAEYAKAKEEAAA